VKSESAEAIARRMEATVHFYEANVSRILAFQPLSDLEGLPFPLNLSPGINAKKFNCH
jgi:hypothetical protein